MTLSDSELSMPNSRQGCSYQRVGMWWTTKLPGAGSCLLLHELRTNRASRTAKPSMCRGSRRQVQGCWLERLWPGTLTSLPAGLELCRKQPECKEKVKTSLCNMDTACYMQKNSFMFMNIEATQLTNPSEALSVSAWPWHRQEIWSTHFVHEGEQTMHCSYIKWKCMQEISFPICSVYTATGTEGARVVTMQKLERN